MADNIDKLISLIKNQNSSLEKLIEENDRLNRSPFDMTSIERLNKLSKEVEESGKIFEKSLNNANSHFDNLFKDKKNLLKDLEKATELMYQKTENFKKEIEKVTKQIAEVNKEISDLNKKYSGDLSKMTKTDKKRYETLNKSLEKHKNNQEKITESYEDAKESLDDLRKSASKYYSDANEEQSLLNKRIVEGTTKLDDLNESFEQRTKALRRGFGEIKSGFNKAFDSAKKVLEPWAKANHEAMAYAKNVGMSQKTADAFLKNTVEWAAKNEIGLLFNKTTDELIKMQSKYSEVLGRNVQLTDEQKKDMLAMESIIGEDSMMDIANNLENFGMGMSDSAAFVKKTFDTATKSGIAASKLTKTIRENIKMAQNYTFKGGLDGLTSMAKKAIELKTDMSLVNGFIEKTSTVEGAISTGAQLQVLGGNYAMGSDPLSMLYDSLNNVEGMFDRAVNMARGKVFYNNKTGNFEMGAQDRYMMKQAAQAMGIDPSKMIDVAFRKASLDKIEGQVKMNSNISNDKEMVDLVKNLASWNNGQAVVNIDGKDKAVSALTSDDKTKLEAMQRTDSQNLQEMAISLRSLNDTVSGIQKETQNEQANLMKNVGEKLTNFLKTNTGLLNTVAKIGAWGNTILGLGELLGGIWTSVNGILVSMNGVGNLFRRRPGRGGRIGGRGGRVGGVASAAGSAKFMRSGILRNSSASYRMGQGAGFGLRENIMKAPNGQMYRKTSLGWQNVNVKQGGVGVLGKNATADLLKNGTKVKGGFTNFASAAGKGLKVGGATALLSAGISLGTDIATGEFKKDTGKSIGKAVGPAIGAVIGGALGGPVGAMIGGFLGDVTTKAIQGAQKKNREKLRKQISDGLSASMPSLAALFEGDNALAGNYNTKQLKKIEEALKDGKLESGELSGAILRKMRANDDLTKISNQGIEVTEKFGLGGIFNAVGKRVRTGFSSLKGLLKGKSHSQGGMKVEGTNKEVEDGEFIVNKKATEANLPLLERINEGDEFEVTAKEPLGKQMSVKNHHYLNGDSLNRKSEISISPISINLSGTIKLDSGNKQIEITNELLNNPQFVHKLTEVISKEINILEYGSYNKGFHKQKFI